MQISFNTEELSERDRATLAFIAGGSAAEKAAPAAAKPAAAKPAAAKPEPEPAAKPEPAAAEDGNPTMADAVARATELVGSGKAAKVKEALASLGAKRVSELEEDKIADFIAALDV